MKSKKPFKPEPFYYVPVDRSGNVIYDALQLKHEHFGEFELECYEEEEARIQKVRIVEYKERKRCSSR